MFSIGGLAAAYYSTTTARATWPGTGSAGGLNFLKRVGDVKLGMEKGEDDSTTRDTAKDGWETSFGTLKKADITITLKKDAADAGYRALLANYLAKDGSVIAMAILDGDVAVDGTEGLWADFEVFKFENGQPVNKMQTVDVTLKPALNTAAGSNAISPQYIRVGTGPL